MNKLFNFFALYNFILYCWTLLLKLQIKTWLTIYLEGVDVFSLKEEPTGRVVYSFIPVDLTAVHLFPTSTGLLPFLRTHHLQQVWQLSFVVLTRRAAAAATHGWTNFSALISSRSVCLVSLVMRASRVSCGLWGISCANRFGRFFLYPLGSFWLALFCFVFLYILT